MFRLYYICSIVFYCMLVNLFLKGLLTGLLVSLPIGPMAVLVIQRTANRDFKSGIFTGLGVALTDSIWALIAGFSVSYIIAFLRHYQSVIQIIGAIGLFSLGLYIFFSNPLKSMKRFKRKKTSLSKCLFSAMAIAFSNPIMILTYIVVFAGANIFFDIYHLESPFVFVTGFLMGAMSWWLVISYFINRFRHHFNLRVLWWFNKISGSFIMTFVAILVITVFIKGNPSI